MPIQSAPQTMTDLLWYLVVVLVAGGIVETLRRLSRIEQKQDEQSEIHSNCRATLLSKNDFKEWTIQWSKGREEIWNAINHHDHDTNGKVFRS